MDYTSKPGETVFITLYKSKENAILSFDLVFKDSNTWHGGIKIASKHLPKNLRFSVFVKDDTVSKTSTLLQTCSINVSNDNTIYINHKPHSSSKMISVRKTKPFCKVFKPVNNSFAKTHRAKKVTHVFNISYPFLRPNIFVCITGSAKKMSFFNNEDPLLFKKKKSDKGTIKLDLSKENFPIEFKIAFFDIDKKCIVAYEPGPNNILDIQPDKNELHIINIEPDCREFLWKGTGINIPVFSLRSNDTWGIGDFTTIKLLVDYAEITGVKMIQLLPVNDSISTYSNADSYPYSAISSFALNPLYLNVATMVEQQNATLLEDELSTVVRINELTYCDYESVIHLKITVLKRLFESVKNEFTVEPDFVLFFETNQEWLVSYAVFCVLRDKFKTTDTTLWGEYKIYNCEKIQNAVQPSGIFYDAALFWYFVQYHLHLQLKSAGKYAHKKGLILKADLPIGVAKQSVDAWVNPTIFNMDIQAGAPPDAFSTVGQNWLF
ncbi:MAG: 4-alpha-glucanotransferase, partial [Ferruginibacter sp.]